VLQERLRDEILGTYLADNVKARDMCSDGSYVRAPRADGDPRVDSQAELIERSVERAGR
jgi:polyphosphate kinase